MDYQVVLSRSARKAFLTPAFSVARFLEHNDQTKDLIDSGSRQLLK